MADAAFQGDVPDVAFLQLCDVVGVDVDYLLDVGFALAVFEEFLAVLNFIFVVDVDDFGLC